MVRSVAISAAMSANSPVDLRVPVTDCKPIRYARQGPSAGSASCHGAAGEVAARPRPLKIETAEAAVHVEHLAHEIQPRAHPRRHRLRIDFGQVDATGCGLRVVVAARA